MAEKRPSTISAVGRAALGAFAGFLPGPTGERLALSSVRAAIGALSSVVSVRTAVALGPIAHPALGSGREVRERIREIATGPAAVS